MKFLIASWNRTRGYVRWALLFLPAAIWAIPVAFILGTAVSGLLQNFCDPEDFHRGSCIADWYLRATGILVYVLFGLTAVSVVWIGASVAPNRKFVAGLVSYITGASLLFWNMGANSHMLESSIYYVPLVSGLLCLFFVKFKYGSI